MPTCLLETHSRAPVINLVKHEGEGLERRAMGAGRAPRTVNRRIADPAPGAGATMKADVVALGEGLLRLSPAGPERFDQTDAFKLHVGGSEANVVVGLARLGWRTAWLSRLTANRLGDRIVAALAAQGVDTTQVLRVPGDRVGCYWLESGAEPRRASVTYDRAGSAMARYTLGDLPDTLFAPGSATLFHTSGITLALSDDAREAALEALKRARAAGWRVSFDTNYRSQLMAPDEAREVCSLAIERADIVHVPKRDAVELFAVDGNEPTTEILRELTARFPDRIIVVTDGPSGARAATAEGEEFAERSFPAQPVDRVGRGDAFMAGFLHGLLSHEDAPEGVRQGLRWGVVMAALKYATPGDLPLVDKETAAQLVSDGTPTDIDR